jgi:hypothetical protein
MSGRHRKATSSNIGVAKIAFTGAVIGGGSLALAGHAVAATDGEWDRVAGCESGNNWGINTGNGYQGGLQFSPSTWSSHGGSQYAPSAHMASKDQQIAVAERVLANQGRGAWPTCGGSLSGPTPRDVPTDPPADEPAEPADNAETVAFDNPMPPEGLPPAPEDLPPFPEDLPPAPEDLPPPPEDLPPPAEDLPPAPDDLPPPAEDLPPPAEDLPPPPEDLPPPAEDLPPAPEQQPAPAQVYEVADHLVAGEAPDGLTLPEDMPVGDQIPVDAEGHPATGYVQELWQVIQEQGINGNEELDALAHPAPPAPQAV